MIHPQELWEPSQGGRDARHPYRWRTWWRGRLPWFLIRLGLADKGRDCESVGAWHRWYNRDGRTSGCYHCHEVRERRILRVEVTFVSTESGGRRAPADLTSGIYRTVAASGTHDSITTVAVVFGIEFCDGSLVSPGESAVATLTAIVHDGGIESVADAGVFTVFEGRNVVAHGRVLASE